MKYSDLTSRDYLARYPRLCAHIIAESLGYADPSVAAKILKDAKEGRDNYCEWITSCYRCNPKPAVVGVSGRRGDGSEYAKAAARGSA